MKVLITGITGHSGSFFYQELKQNHYAESLKLIVRDESKRKNYEKELNAEVITGSLEDQLLLEKAMEGVETVFHIASIYYSENIVRAAIKNKVKTIILVHTTGIYSKYKMASQEYQEIEVNIKEQIQKAGHAIKVIILRPTMIYGRLGDRNMEKFIKMIDTFRIFPIINYGRSLLQPVNGKDLGKAYYQILENLEIVQGEYILSGKDKISLLELLNLIAELLGKKRTFINVPLSVGVILAKGLKVLTLGRIDYIEKVLRLDENRDYNHDKAILDFGYSPMNLDAGLSREITEYKRSKVK